MRSRLLCVFLLLAGVLAQGGCATVFGNFFPMTPRAGAGAGEARVYGGVRIHLENCETFGEGHFLMDVLFVFLSVIDFPLCIAADTVTLPITIPTSLFGEDDEEADKPEDE